MEFLLNNLPIIVCILAAVALLAFEVFMPGFGIPGIAGMVMFAVAVYLTNIRYGSIAALGMFLAALAICGLAITFSVRSASRGRISKSPLVLKDTSAKDAGYSAGEDMSPMIGREGVAQTVLRPAGIALIGDARVNVQSRGGFIQKGAQVVVVAAEGAKLIVEEIHIHHKA